MPSQQGGEGFLQEKNPNRKSPPKFSPLKINVDTKDLFKNLYLWLQIWLCLVSVCQISGGLLLFWDLSLNKSPSFFFLELDFFVQKRLGIFEGKPPDLPLSLIAFQPGSKKLPCPNKMGVDTVDGRKSCSMWDVWNPNIKNRKFCSPQLLRQISDVSYGFFGGPEPIDDICFHYPCGQKTHPFW